jgi:hypothetical protein
MIVPTVNQRNGKSRPGPSLFRRHAVLGTVCLVLCVALSLALDALVRAVTGGSHFAVSLTAAFLAVLLLYGKLEAWCGLDPEPPQPQPEPPGEE